MLRKIVAAAAVSFLGAQGLAVDQEATPAGGAGVDLKGNAYAKEPWDATFSVDLDGKPGGEQGQFTIRVHPEWAPLGAARFQDLVAGSVLKDARFFRVVPDFMVQFGIPGDPNSAKEWKEKNLKDDDRKQSNQKGMMTFATAGPNTRTTQMFINYKDNSFLDNQGFSPFAEVLGNGMDVVGKIQNKYGEQPDQGLIETQGNAYLNKDFPDLSYVNTISSKLYPAAGAAPIAANAKQVTKETERKQTL